MTLTGCSAGTPQTEVSSPAAPPASAAPSATAPSPAASPAASPTASISVDPETWATRAIPVNTTDAAELWREFGVVDGTRADYTVSGLDGGSWVVSFACVAADGTRADLTVAPETGPAETLDVECTADPSAPPELFLSVRDEGSSAELSVQSEVSTVFVVTVSRDLKG